MNIFVVIELDKKYNYFSLILFSQSFKLISNNPLRIAFGRFSSDVL